MSPSGTRRHIKQWAATALIVAGIVSGVVYSVVGPDRGRVTVLSLIASSDLGALPARGTGAGQFCGEVGTLGAPYRCYVTGGTGNLTDLGTAGVTLTKTGVVREAVSTGLPVQSGAVVNWTSELTSAFDGAGEYSAASAPQQATTKISVTLVYTDDMTDATARRLYYHYQWSPVRGITINANDSTTMRTTAYGAAGSQLSNFTRTKGTHCITVVVDTTGANLAYVYQNGAVAVGPRDYSGVGDMSNATPILSIGRYWSGTIPRVRVDHAVATLADHKLLCGEYTRPLRTSHAAYADSTWSGGTGGARAFPMSATTAVTLPGSAAGYGWDGTSVGWRWEDSRTNRLLYNSQINCVNWTCSGLGGELLADGDMETAGVGSWPNKAGNVGTVTKDTTAPLHGGAQHLRIAHLADTHPGVVQLGLMTVGKYYYAAGWARASGAGVVPALGGFFGIDFTVGGTAWNTKDAFRQATQTYFLAQAYNADAGGEYAEFDDLSLKEVFPTITSAVAPDGSLTAALVDFTGAETLSKAAAGYTALTTVYPTMWIKCSAGTLAITNTTGTGNWSVNCTHATLNGNWARIHRTHAAVAVTTAWASDAAGAVTPTFAGADFSLWLPTITMIEGESVIPTLAAVVATSDQAWTLNNAGGKYHATSDTIIGAPTTYPAACFVAGTTLRLTGAVGAECTSYLRSLEVRR